MKKLFLLIVLFVFIGASALWAQTRIITGTVTSAIPGEGSIPGVTVQVKGTTIGAATDINGKYSISVPQNATTLVFSYIGMKRYEVEIAGRSVIDCILESDILGLDEVVVSAFGIRRNANEIGAAITKVDADLITQAKATNAASALSGKVAGLQINTVNAGVSPDVRVLLRGNRSFLGNNQALLVLDGVTVNLSYLSTLNPNDIESMNVLKGGNAAALYGSEAANGVIVVTTKSGSRDRTTIQYSTTTTFDKVAYFPDLQKRFGSGASADKYGNPIYEPFENQCWGPEFDGSIVQIGLDDEYGNKQMVQYSARPEEKIKFWDTGITFQNDISFSSGNETSTIYLSLQDVNVKGVVPGDESRRDVIRFNASKTYKGFTANANFNYTIRTVNSTRSDVYWNMMNTPMHIPLSSYRDWDAIPAAGETNWADINHYFNAYYPNPYEQVDRQRQESRNDYFTGVITLSQDITKSLKFSVRSAIAPNSSYWEDRNYSRTFSPYGLSMYTLYGRSISRAHIPSSMGTGQTYAMRFTNNFLLTFDNRFNDISVRAIAGAETRSSYSRGTRLSAAALEINDFFNVKNRIGELGLVSGYSSFADWNQQRSMAVFGDVTIGYKNFVYLHGSGRNDWTSLLDVSNWSFFYPGVDASVILSEFIPALKGRLINHAKLRGGISKVGSINIDNYSLENTFSTASNFPFGSLSAYRVSDGLNNRFIEPEFTLSREIGLELSFLRDRINTSVTAYKTNTTNQTVEMSISRATGYTNSKINAGEMLNKGIEVELKTIPVQTSNFRWQLDLNYSYWYNRVVDLAGDLDEIYIDNYVYAIKGMAYPTIKVTQFARDEAGRVIVDPVTGVPTISPLVIPRGQTTPKHLIGIQTNVSWKNFTLSASADYRGGHVFRANIYYDLLFTGIGALSTANGRERFIFPNSVIPDGEGGYIPNTNITVQEGSVAWWTSTMRQLSYYSVVSADVWKIREISLAYDVPATVFSFTNNVVKGARLAIVGRNLFMFLPKNNIYTDPEFNSGTGNAVGYTNSRQTPPTRSYGVNATLTF